MTESNNKKEPELDYKVCAEALAGCVIWALNFLDTESSTALLFDADTGKAEAWQHKFFDALDKCGIKYDREKYFKDRYGND